MSMKLLDSAPSTNDSEESTLETVAPYVAEFVGTFLLVFTVGSCGIAGSSTWNATGVACVLVVLIYVFGPVSGGHLNPSVSIAVGLAGKMDMMTVLKYVVTQIVAGLLGGLLYYSAFGTAVPVAPLNGFGWFQAGIVEVIYTAMICFVVLNCALSTTNNPKDDQNHFFALAIGFVIVAGGYAGGRISGACLNPAVSLGLDITGAGRRRTGGDSNPWCIVYVIYQVLGAVIAALLFYICRHHEWESISKRNSGWPTLQVRILAAHNLMNKDSGIAGDVSDPYVMIRYATRVYRTPTIRDNLNPVWDNDNVYFFDLRLDRIFLELEVVNANAVLIEQSLGTLSLNLKTYALDKPHVVREPLKDGKGGELELELLLGKKERREEDEEDAPSEDSGVAGEPSLFSKLMSEFCGTFILVLTVGLNVVMVSPATAWSAAAALMCMIYSLGNVCGGHFNPAVTLAVVLSRRDKCPSLQGVYYVIVQLLAGIFAGLLYATVHFSSPYKSSGYFLAPVIPYSWAGALMAELVFTFMLAFVVLAVATTTPPGALTMQNFQFAIAIGSCVTAGGFSIGNVSGGSLNPAVSWGMSAASSAWHGSTESVSWANCLAYSLIELLGGACAALLFHATHMREYSKHERRVDFAAGSP